MTEHQWSSIEAHFEALLGLPPEARQSGLAAIDDEVVRSEVASLLNHSHPTESLQGVIGAMAAHAGSPATTEELQPHRLGPYRVTGIIGQGGMGAVYKAVRDDQSFEKKVAIKVMHLGMDTPAARERFRQERQILAGLEHPNIAHLLDGGETGTGLSYIVLEYVDGENIIAHCNRRSLGQDERLRLFLQVCAAVQFAHQNLVVHRDLKPGNIMVTQDGTPKLLDFGIAKLIDPTIERTATLLQAMTPNYASPEQVLGGQITTATDVYSLGIVLFELLTGRLPYEIPTLTPRDIHRTVCEVQPAPPGISSDLDTVILMALRKEPARRYGSVQLLADDIQRAIDHHPVRARPDTTRYRVEKYLRRNRVPVAAVVLVVLSLAIGLGVAAYQAHLAQQRFQQVRKLANTFLFQIHDAIVDIPGTTQARALVLKTALEYLDSLASSAGNDSDLQAELAQAYEKVAQVQGSPRQASLGDPKAAMVSYRKALSLYDALSRRDSKYAVSSARCLRFLAFLNLSQLHFQEAKSLIAEAFGRMEPFRSSESPDVLKMFSFLYQTTADIEETHGSLDVAVENSRHSLEYLNRWVKTLPANQLAKANFDIAAVHLRLGRTLYANAKLRSAEPELLASLPVNQKALQIEPHNARYLSQRVSILLNLAGLYGASNEANLENYSQSARYDREAIDAVKSLVDADPHDQFSHGMYTDALFNLAYSLSKLPGSTGFEEAKKGVALWKERRGTGRPLQSHELSMVEGLRSVLPIIGAHNEHAEALKLAREIVEIRRQILAPIPTTEDDWWFLIDNLIAEADESRSMGDRRAARRILDEALRISLPFAAAADESVPSAFVASRFYNALTRDRAANGNCPEAQQWWKKDIEVWQKQSTLNEYAAIRYHRAQNSPPVCGH